MKIKYFVLPLALVSLSACSVALEANARSDLQAQCAAKGMQFVVTDAKKTELLVVSSAQVTGVCVGPGDPRYVPPKAPSETPPSKT